MIGIVWEIVAAGFLASTLIGIVDSRLSRASLGDWNEHEVDQ